MTSTVADEKKQWRQQLIRQRDAMTTEQCRAASHRMTALIEIYLGQYGFRQIFLFNSIGNEPYLHGLRDILVKRMIVGLPRVNTTLKKISFHRFDSPDALIQSRFGIDEPPETATLLEPEGEGDTLIVVPGLAFDHSGYRLGYGAGFYDRYLTEYSGRYSTMGLVYHAMVLNDLPHDAHDRPVQGMVTERGITLIC